MNVATPRVALLISGLPRQWRRCLTTQMDLLRGYPCDVYFHFWDTIETKEKDEIVDLIRPKAYVFEPLQDFTHLDTDASIRPDIINAPSRIVSQHYSWRGVGQLVEPYKDAYDVALRTRADLQFVYTVDHILSRVKPHELVVNWWERNSTFADMFAIGGIEPILYYHRLFDYERIYATTTEFNAEILLTTHLKQRSDIKTYIEEQQLFFIRRPHMDHYTIEEAMAENAGRNKWLDPEVNQAYAAYHYRRKGEEGAVFFDEMRRTQLELKHDFHGPKDNK